jgi:hypothetical protein
MGDDGPLELVRAYQRFRSQFFAPAEPPHPSLKSGSRETVSEASPASKFSTLTSRFVINTPLNTRCKTQARSLLYLKVIVAQ